MIVNHLLLLAFLRSVSSVSLSPQKSLHMDLRKREKREITSIGKTLKMVISDINYLDSTEGDFGHKETYQELKTYALLKRDIRGSLPSNFTICSSVFTTKDYAHHPFTLLGKDDDVLVFAFIQNEDSALVNTSGIRLSIRVYQHFKKLWENAKKIRRFLAL